MNKEETDNPCLFQRIQEMEPTPLPDWLGLHECPESLSKREAALSLQHIGHRGEHTLQERSGYVYSIIELSWAIIAQQIGICRQGPACNCKFHHNP